MLRAPLPCVTENGNLQYSELYMALIVIYFLNNICRSYCQMKDWKITWSPKLITLTLLLSICSFLFDFHFYFFHFFQITSNNKTKNISCSTNRFIKMWNHDPNCNLYITLFWLFQFSQTRRNWFSFERGFVFISGFPEAVA